MPLRGTCLEKKQTNYLQKAAETSREIDLKRLQGTIIFNRCSDLERSKIHLRCIVTLNNPLWSANLLLLLARSK
jgi:hypothetical protein